MMATKGPTKTVSRSSVSGRFVTGGYAKTHKSTTETQRIHTSKKK
ncbi:hypothetical protein [Methylobacterium tardum]|nr:hypothetical protein [Methylobacterium tardum]